MMQNSGRRGCKGKILLSAFTETVHECWKLRNCWCFGKDTHTQDTEQKIIDAVVYKCWSSPKLREQISILLLP